MNVDVMRDIDRWFGVPITFILTGVIKLTELFAPKEKPEPKKILFLELSEMGSTILADPAMRKARKVFDAELFFCIFSKNKESLLLLNTIEEKNIFIMRETSVFALIADSIKFFFWTRKEKIDAVVDLELFARVTAILTGLSGAGRRAGFFSFHNEGLYRGNMMTHKVAYNPHIHIAKNFIALVNALISDNSEVPYSKTLIEDDEITIQKVHPTEEEKKHVLDKLKDAYAELDKEKHHIVIVNANASDLLPQRRWPKERFASLISMILEFDKDAVIFLTGASSGRNDLESLKDLVKQKRCINFAGGVKFAELPVLYSMATLMVTNDSGPGHFSAVTDMPTFVLFGPETPALYGSLGNSIPIFAGLACSPCVTAVNYRKTPCTDNVCLKVISPEYVFDKIKPYLKSNVKEPEGTF